MNKEDLFTDLEDILTNLQEAYNSVSVAVDLITTAFNNAKEFGGDLSKALSESIAVRKSILDLGQLVADEGNKIDKENK